jgi:hypothetical protein
LTSLSDSKCFTLPANETLATRLGALTIPDVVKARMNPIILEYAKRAGELNAHRMVGMLRLAIDDYTAQVHKARPDPFPYLPNARKQVGLVRMICTKGYLEALIEDSDVRQKVITILSQ